MGFLSNIFGGSGISPEKYGSLLADAVKGKLKTQFDVDNLPEVREEFRNNSWVFRREKYEVTITGLWIRQSLAHVILVHSDRSESDIRSIFSSFMDSFPDEYSESEYFDDDVISTANEIVLSDRPNITASRLAATEYFGPEPNLEQVTHFGLWANMFQEILDVFEEEVDF